jgi:FkbM family methyltransferase
MGNFMYSIFAYIVRHFIGTGIGRFRRLTTFCNRIATLLLPKGEQVVDLGSFSMQVTIDGKIDYIAMAILAKKEYEPAVTSIFKSLLRQGDCVVDVGANIGYFSLLAGSIVGNAGCVFAFEPNIDNMKVLKHNIGLNHFHWIVPIQKAAGNYVGEGIFYTSDNNWGGSLVKTREHEGNTTVEVDKLDNMNFGRNIRLLKIDTDGNDLEVLKGAEKLILNGHVDAFIAEVYPAGLMAAGSSVEDFWEYIKSLGMEHIYVIDNNSIVPCKSSSQLATIKQSVNLFCSKKGYEY